MEQLICFIRDIYNLLFNRLSKRQEFNIDFQTFVKPASISTGVAAITFFNQGTASVVINGTVTLATGISLAVEGNTNEIDVSVYRITFTGGGTQQLVVVRKYYQ
jgi:hypothetical protein